MKGQEGRVGGKCVRKGMGGGDGGARVSCHLKSLSTPSGTLEGKVGRVKGLQQSEAGRKKEEEEEKTLGPLEKSGRDSKNTLRAEKPSGPGVNIRWVAAPERSDSQQRP